MKSLASKLRTGAMIGLAGLALGATAPKANATTLEYANTTIADDVDQDLTRDGFQIKYNWEVKNASNQGGVEDLIWRYSIQSDLEAKGMYGFQNNDIPEGFDFFNGSTSYFHMNANGEALPPGNFTTFSALIDKDLVIGNEQVGSYGTSNEGQTNIVNVTVPIPEPMTMGLLASGAGVLLVGRRLRENAKRR
jgi:hypothetical protein